MLWKALITGAPRSCLVQRNGGTLFHKQKYCVYALRRLFSAGMDTVLSCLRAAVLYRAPRSLRLV